MSLRGETPLMVPDISRQKHQFNQYIYMHTNIKIPTDILIRPVLLTCLGLKHAHHKEGITSPGDEGEVLNHSLSPTITKKQITRS